MTLVSAVPLVVALCCLSLIAGAKLHTGVDRVLTRVSIQLFGDTVTEFKHEHPDRQAALHAAHTPTTYREYGATTILYALLVALAGSILGIYVIWGLLLVLAIDPETMREALPSALGFLANLGGVPTLSVGELAALLVVSCLTIGALVGAGTYWLRWWYPTYVADGRARRIDTALPSTVAFMYALSRSGMEFPKIVRIVSQQEATYGEAATEFDVAVRNMDAFGMDAITALQTMGRRSASSKFQEFTENLVSVLQSGHSLSEFLEGKYHDFQEESESQQEQTLEMLGTLAEAYVTVLVAGPLFLITILVVIGISVGDTLEPLQALIYVILPFGNLAFVVYLSMVTDSITPGTASPTESTTSASGVGIDSPTAGITTQPRPRPDGGMAHAHDGQANIERVQYYQRFKHIRKRLTSPISTLLERPTLSLVVTIPIALGVIAWRLPAAFTESGFDVTVIDDVIAIAALFVLTVFAIFYELHRRRLEAIEAAVPDLLDRLASVNDAGMSIVSSIDHVRGSDLGPLDEELDRIWADVQWGADLQSALGRFERRVRTRATSRVVTLLTEAMNASDNLATVLRIAARQAAADRRLKRERKQSMVEYMIVVYISFLVFLFIIAVLAAYLLPNLPTDLDMGDAAAGVGGLEGLGGEGLDTFTTVFYHATLVQGLLSGLIAGQLSSGDLRAGAKHAATMIGLSVLLFAVLV
ncbi:type II secretion system F family protein [Natronolimnobius baerhuensis]|uniref:Type II secretion protein F n=1 Tax=Natronolimnobius baerhuensis TaxID=253108 RepID=A0A202E9E2_9EURY|nr:type II secretion system F family protein [Natronolimnobius baerhuensis]OVE84778.1 type II secretion protein F [Natronolimnobius baerhuensis]